MNLECRSAKEKSLASPSSGTSLALVQVMAHAQTNTASSLHSGIPCRLLKIVHPKYVQHGVRILCTWCVCNMVCVYCALGVCATWCAYIVHLVCVQHGVCRLCTWCVCNMVCVYCALGVCATWCAYIVHLVCVPMYSTYLCQRHQNYGHSGL